MPPTLCETATFLIPTPTTPTPQELKFILTKTAHGFAPTAEKKTVMKSFSARAAESTDNITTNSGTVY